MHRFKDKSRKTLLQIGACGLIAIMGVTGYSASSIAGGGDAKVAAAAHKASEKHLAAAKKALAKDKFDVAVAEAEKAVALEPTKPAARIVLGRAYMMAGKFKSAENAYADAMSLGGLDGQSAVNLSLMMIANNHLRQAVSVLDQHREAIPAQDYGLALALAGETNRAVRVLDDAARDPNASPQLRQNLALAFALQGNWLNAKIVASQDVPGGELQNRMDEWAQLAQNKSNASRVASLIGINPVTDSGMPSGLALSSVVDEPQVAVNDPAPLSEYAPNVPQMAAVAPSDANGAPVGNGAVVEIPGYQDSAPAAELAAPAPPPLPDVHPGKPVNVTTDAVISVNETPVTEIEAPVLAAPAKPMKVKPTNTVAVRMVSSRGGKVARHDVQIGSYRSAKAAKRGWNKMRARYAGLRGQVHAIKAVRVKGRTYYRLSVVGVGNQKVAYNLCAGIKGRGGDCFVRSYGTANAAPRYARKASRKTVRSAKRRAATRVAAR